MHARLRPLPLTILILWLVAAACQRGTPERDERERQVAAFATKRAEYAKKLAAMNVTQLAAALQSESMRGLEPFNAMSYQEMVTRGKAAAEELRAQLQQPTRASFLGLLALRAIDSAAYQTLTPAFRVEVLLDALRNSRHFNAWGMPHTGWEDAAKALIAEGKAAEPGLIRLLEDRRRAPMWGSEDAVESDRYGYRVRDYAWAMLRAIRGEEASIPVGPESRDSLIGRMSSQR